MKETYLFGDLPHAADPVRETEPPLDRPDARHSIFGLAEQLSGLLPEAEQSEQDATATAEATVALNAVQWWLPGASEAYLTQEAYEAMGLPTTSVCKALDFSLSGAESLNKLTHLLYREQTTAGEPTPLMDWLNARQYSPDEARVLMQYLRDDILYNAESVSRDLANVLVDLLINHKAMEASHEVDDKATALVEQDETRILQVEHLRHAVRKNFKGVPDADIGGMPAGKLLDILKYDGRRRRIIAESPPSELPGRENPQNIAQSALLNIRPEPARQRPEYTGDPTAREAASLRDEIADLLHLHRERAIAYRGDLRAWPPTPTLKNLLVRQQLLGTHSNRDVVDRIVDLMLTFSELGSTSREPHEIVQLDLERQLTEFFTFERAIGANLQKGVLALKAAGVTARLNDWKPVESDVALLDKRWRHLLPAIRENWPEGDGQKVVIAITNVLRAFNVYRNEIADPEGRLKTIATHIGATVLRPENRPKAATLEPVQRHNAISDILEAIASDEQLQQNTRYRAEVLKHFIAGDTTSESRESQPAELFYIPPTREQSVPYFCVSFRSPKGAGWILIESLRYGKASYIFPQALVEREGEDVTLADFLDKYSKPKLVQNGGIQIIHTDGWTPNSHIGSIREKVTIADSIDAL